MQDFSTSRPIPFNDTAVIPSKLNFPVVGLGASAGGIQALITFFKNLPANTGMAFVVVLHLSPEHESSVVSILQRAANIPVVDVPQLTLIEKDKIYVISPNQQLEMNDGYLKVLNFPRPIGQHIAIDLFFRSLAEVHRERAFGIILSGTGTDGALGLARLKEQGAVTLVQQPEDAEYDGMPNAAIDTGLVDFVLPAAELPQKLINLWSNTKAIRLPTVSDSEIIITDQIQNDGQQAEEALRDIIILLRSRTGHDFQPYKRATVLRRIERRLQVRQVPDLSTYGALLKSEAVESTALLHEMLIGVTQFFRDQEAFDILEQNIIPAIFDGKKAGEQVRSWSAGCSSGEEAYSLAMLFNERAKALPDEQKFIIFASDLDERAIARARTGLYPAAIENDLSEARLAEYFTKEDAHFRIKKALRDKILFASQSLLRDPPFSKLDMISCRNLLIYLNRDTHAQILEMFHFALNPHGYLLLGSSESADALSDFFTPVDKKNRIYRANPVSRFSRATFHIPVRSALPLSISLPSNTVEKRKPSFAEIHQRALVESAPPSILVDQQENIVYLSEGTEKFLRYIAGEPSRDLFALIEPELRLELRTAIFQAIQNDKTVETRRISIQRDAKFFSVTMSVRPFHDTGTGIDLVLILFHQKDRSVDESIVVPVDMRQDTILSGLEDDLQRTKMQLQDTIEHSETSKEELKASNEELQAINEELRSATEELETSKEELQSANEELVTVNYELKIKIDEMSKVNDDLKNLITSTDIATIFVDRSMHIKRYTPRAADIFNILPGDVGRPLHDITHKLDYPELEKDASTSFELLRIGEREVSSSDGRWFIARILPYRTDNDRIEGSILTFIDISGRRRAEDKVRLNEERMHLVAASTKDYVIVTIDREGMITSFNSGAERIFGYAEKDILGMPDSILFTPEDRDAGIPSSEKHRALKEGRAEDERWHLRKDGTRFFCSGIMTPLMDGEFYGFAKIGRDLTGRVEVEKQRAEQLSQEQVKRAEAQAANALKDEFLAIMSHELKHPLNLIHMNAELLMRYPETRLKPAISKAVAAIHSSAVSQAKIINDLLDLSRLNTGKMTLAIREFDLRACGCEIVELTKTDPTVKALNMEFECVEETLPILADQVRIEQVIWNLLNNAIKFTPANGTIHVSIRSEESYARLDVIDNGQGIVPEILPRIFDMFGQGTPSIIRGVSGLGIGLALVRQIVELHEGHVEAASSGVGLGSCFSVWLPLAKRPDVRSFQIERRAETGLAGLTILLVDDAEDALEVLQTLLEIYGAKVYCATNGHLALPLLSEQAFDLVISDISMPGMDGYTFMKELRKNDQHKALPTIALTGFGRAKDAECALEAGFTSHINKPVAIDDLIELIRKIRNKAIDQ
jgi:two-component system CheB/CheR fusion protein